MPCGRERDLSEVDEFQRKLLELVNSQARVKLTQVLHWALVFFCNLVHDKIEISQHYVVLNFFERVFNQFENIPPQNKDTAVVSVRKVCLIMYSVTKMF